jgi:hypothetical protein
MYTAISHKSNPSSEHDAKPLTDSCARAPLPELCDSVPRPKARGPDRANDNKKPRRALGVSRARDLRVEQATVSLIRRAADSENLQHLVIRIEAQMRTLDWEAPSPDEKAQPVGWASLGRNGPGGQHWEVPKG